MKFCPKCQTVTERYADGKCKPCSRAANAAWKAANPDKVRNIRTADRVANPEKFRARAASYRAANPERVRAYRAAYRAANQEKTRAENAAYHAANREKERARCSTYRAANPEKRRIYKHNRRARKLESGGKLSPGIAAKLFRLQRGKCACGCKQPLGDDYHLDHRMPLALGGPNTDDNIQLLRSICNQQKHAKHPIDFMQQRGFLL